MNRKTENKLFATNVREDNSNDKNNVKNNDLSALYESKNYFLSTI